MTQNVNEDPRETGLKNGLRQLKVWELARVILYQKEMVLDTYQYQEGKFCPLAVGIGLDLQMKDPDNHKVQQELLDRGYKIFNTRGIKGDFYTTERKRDLIKAAHEVLLEKLDS